MFFLFIFSLFSSSIFAQSTAPSSSRPSPSPPSSAPSSSSPPSIVASPTGSPSFHAAEYDLYFTVEATMISFSPDVFLDELKNLFHWPSSFNAEYVKSMIDPYNASQLVAQYKIDGDQAAEAFQIWEATATNLTARSTAGVFPLIDMSTSPPPPRGCANDIIIDCQPTSFQNADLRDCVCETGLTGLGVFTYVILPIALIIAVIVAVCFFLPGCPLYQRAPVDRRQYKAPPQNGEGEGTRIAMATNDSEA